MVPRAQAFEVRSKMIGVLLRAARLKAGKTVKDCAEWLGCSTHIISQYEYGRRAISLPELEMLAQFFRVPVNHLWDEELAEIDQDGSRPPVEKLMELRHKEIGILIRQNRSSAGKTQKQCSDIIGVSTETISKYEYGSRPIPFAYLELLADFLELPVTEFLDQESIPGGMSDPMGDPGLLSPQETWDTLPEKIRQFIRNPESRPYLEMAARLYESPRGSLRHLAEAILATED
jgi:transcriptional regulator with XRE-family HTH domain